MSKQPIKSLVVGIDLSPYSKIVVQQARTLSKKMKIPAVYVYVCQVTEYQESFIFDRSAAQKNYELEVRKKYSLENDEQVVIRFGRAFEEVIAAAKKFKRPLVLVGYRGMNPLARLFIGSTAERLALCSPFPVWVHRGAKIVLPKSILIPSDLSERSDRTARTIAALKKSLTVKTELYHVLQEPIPVMDYQVWETLYEEMKKNDDRRVKAFKKRHPSLKTVRATGNVVAEIRRRAKGFDMIALSPRFHKGKAPLFGSVTAKLLRSGDTPILVVP